MSEDIQQLILWLIPAAPLLAAISTALLGPKLLRHKSHLPCWSALALSFVCSLILLLKILPTVELAAAPVEGEVAIAHSATGPQVIASGYEWFSVGSLHANIELRADSITAIMLSMVTGVSLLVAMFGSGYMSHDPGYPRFFAAVSLFVFSFRLNKSLNSFMLKCLSTSSSLSTTQLDSAFL